MRTFEDHSTARCAPPSWATESSPNSRKTRSYRRSARSVPASPRHVGRHLARELVQVQPPQRPAVARVAREQRALHDLGQVHDAEDGQVEVREMRLEEPPLVRCELFDRVIHGAAMLLAARSDLRLGATDNVLSARRREARTLDSAQPERRTDARRKRRPSRARGTARRRADLRPAAGVRGAGERQRPLDLRGGRARPRGLVGELGGEARLGRALEPGARVERALGEVVRRAAS